MPTHPIPYDVILARHPDQVAACIRQVRKGKAKAKDTDPATWTWEYKWGTMVNAYSLAEAINGTASMARVSWKSMSPQERVDDTVLRSRPVWLQGSPPGKRTCGSEGLDPTFFPNEAREKLLVTYEAEVAEEKRVASLTPAEREAELQEALNQLRGPGFLELRFR